MSSGHGAFTGDTPPRTPFTAGMTRRDVICPHNGNRLPVSYWYPAREAETVRREGIYDLRAAVEAPPVPGRYGLVVISHGSGGSDINHHDWAEALARAGYVVAAPRHVGDSHDYDLGIGSREQLLERPRQLRAALQSALDDAVLGPLVDPGRIGLMGFSAGGYTSLLLLGARPDFTRWDGYCRARSEGELLCPVGEPPSVPEPTPDDWRGLRDPRVKGAVLMAPFALLFDAANISGIRAPILLYRADGDIVTANPDNADHLAVNLVSPVRVVTVSGGHYVFIAPVDDTLAKKYPEYYVDPPGVDRHALHTRLAGEIIGFYDGMDGVSGFQ